MIELQEELLSSDVPTHDVMDNRYNELLLKVTEGSFYGIPKEYLSKLVSKIVGSHIEVEGYVEKLLLYYPVPVVITKPWNNEENMIFAQFASGRTMVTMSQAVIVDPTI